MLHDQIKHNRKVYYSWISLENISPDLAIAVVASEDQKFPSHYGFDIASIQEALSEDSKRPRGASTITQQLAKNLYLWPERSYLRKAIEAYFTVLIEFIWGKQRILEVYLNVVEFAEGVYGVGAASTILFDKSAGNLSLAEATRLAAVLPNPKKMSAKDPSFYVLKRSKQIQSEIQNLGGIGYLDFLQK